MLVEGLVIEVRVDTVIDLLTGVMVDGDMLADVDIIVEAVVVADDLEFLVLISYVVDVVAGVMICCVGFDVLTDMNVISLTAPSKEAMPSFRSAFDCRPMTALGRDSVLQLWMPAYQV